MIHDSIEMIEIIAKGLKELLSEVTFIGGAITSFYIDDSASPALRPTKDVDCVIKIANQKNYYEFETKIRKKGFRHLIRANEPICRWIYDDVIVDIMPTDKSILGFSNRWYDDGINNSIVKTLPSGRDIKKYLLKNLLS